MTNNRVNFTYNELRTIAKMGPLALDKMNVTTWNEGGLMTDPRAVQMQPLEVAINDRRINDGEGIITIECVDCEVTIRATCQGYDIA